MVASRRTTHAFLLVSLCLLLILVLSTMIHGQRRKRVLSKAQPQQQQQQQQTTTTTTTTTSDVSSSDHPIMGQHSFQPPYLMNYGTGAIPNWEYGGSTLATETYIRLVPAIQSRTGYMYNTQPVQTDNWQVDIKFQVHNTHSPGADGMAFWYVKKPERTSGPLFGQKEYFDGLGIVFDSYDNNANGDGPSVIAIRGTGDLNTKWDIDNDLLGNQLDRCRADFRNAIGGIVSARITYLNKKLNVEIDTVGAGRYSQCISVERVELPTGYHFELTAATGGLADYHDIYSFIAHDLNGAASAHDNQQTQEGDGESHRKEHEHHGWFDPYKYYKDQLDNAEIDDAIDAASAATTGKKQKKKEKTTVAKEDNTNTHPHSYSISEPVDDDHIFKMIEEKLKGMDHPEAKNEDKSSSTSPSDISHEEKELSISTRTNLLILEALEEVARTVKVSSTKDDITSVIAQITGMLAKQQAVQNELIQLKDSIKQDFSSMMKSLEKEGQNLHNGITKLENYMSGLNVQVDDLTVKQGRLHTGFEEHSTQLHSTIKSSTSYGFWLFFILFQTAFVVGFIYYRKYSAIKSYSKLY